MTYEDKIERARELVAQHNRSVDPEDQIDFDSFLAKLRKSGGTSEDRLKSCSFEDLQELGLPKLLAKDVAQVFRSGAEPEKKPFVTPNKAAAMGSLELLGRYDPREADNPIGKRLVELSKGNPVIVFNEDGTVNVEASNSLLEEIRDNYSPRTSVLVEGVPRPVYRVGARPGQFVDENPLYPGRPLRRDEVCDQTNRSWTGVQQVVRVLIHLAVNQTHECRVDSIDDAHSVLDRVMQEDAEQAIRNRYQKASLLYDELKAKGELPSLKIDLGQSDTRRNDPFAVAGSGHRTS